MGTASLPWGAWRQEESLDRGGGMGTQEAQGGSSVDTQPKSEADTAGLPLAWSRLLSSLPATQADGIGPDAILPLPGHLHEDL